MIFPTRTSYKKATDQITALADMWGVAEVWVTEFDAGKLGSQDAQLIIHAMNYWLGNPRVTRVAYYQDFKEAATQNSPLTNKNGQITEFGKSYKGEPE